MLFDTELFTKLAFLYQLKILKWLFSVDGSTIIYNLGLGIGGFLGGLAGLRYIGEWLEKQRRQQLIREYQRRYPKKLEDNEQGWELSHNPERKGHLYLLDHRDKTRHWIANWRTFQDLFTNVPNDGDERKDQLFREYTDKDHILTFGEPEP
jgi:hypothetical protein